MNLRKTTDKPVDMSVSKRQVPLTGHRCHPGTGTIDTSVHAIRRQLQLQSALKAASHCRDKTELNRTTLCRKNDTDVAHYNFNAQQPTLIFGRNFILLRQYAIEW